MRWGDEEFCKLYRRLPSRVKALPWEARALWLALWHAVDRAGVLTLDDDAATCVAAELGWPIGIVRRTLPELVAIEQVRIAPGMLWMPDFFPAQQARQSDAARKRSERARAATGIGPCETPKDGPQNATPGAPYSPPRRAKLGASGRGHEVAPAVRPTASPDAPPPDVTKRDCSSVHAYPRDGLSPLEQMESRDPEVGETGAVLWVLTRLRAEGSDFACSVDERLAKGWLPTTPQLATLRKIGARWAAAAAASDSRTASARVAKGGRQAPAPAGQEAWTPVAMEASDHVG